MWNPCGFKSCGLCKIGLCCVILISHRVRPILASVPGGVTPADVKFVSIPMKMDAQRELDEGQDEADGGNDKTEHVQKSGGKSSETERKMSELHPNANCRKQNKTFTNKTNFSTAHAFLF